MSEPLRPDAAALLLVDLQERLLAAIADRDALVRNAVNLTRVAALFAIPQVVTTQYAQGIGPIVGELAAVLDAGAEVTDKVEFSCLANPVAASRLAALGARTWIVAGAEAHICVLQTVEAARRAGHDVVVAADAIGSRTAANHALALARLREIGARVLPTESIIYELLGRAGSPEFRAMLPHLK